MKDPYHWDFPTRSDTMYMSTISNKDILGNASFYNPNFHRQSSFLKSDIPGAQNKRQISQFISKERRPNFLLSTTIEPRPQDFRTINKNSDPLKTNDIEGAHPRANQFRTRRIVDPLAPIYKLPSVPHVKIDWGRNFIRDTLNISDINNKQKQRRSFVSPQKQPIQKSTPTKLFRTVDNSQTQKFDVQDINKYRRYYSKRRYVQQPKNPLNPQYIWRDNYEMEVNNKLSYMDGDYTKPKKLFSNIQKRKSLNVSDIEGAHHDSYNQRRYFLDKRKQFKDYMNMKDLPETHASSLKKGIQRRTAINPLMPNYSSLSRY